jgi:hypothetical protein
MRVDRDVMASRSRTAGDDPEEPAVKIRSCQVLITPVLSSSPDSYARGRSTGRVWHCTTKLWRHMEANWPCNVSIIR